MGGWSFGYRLLVDTMPLAVLFLIPVLDTIVRSKWLLGGFGMLLGWSVVVQVVGAFAYNLSGWNAPFGGYAVQVADQREVVIVPDREALDRLAETQPVRSARPLYRDIDLPEYRHRLWSVTDSQIKYYLTHFGAARREKQQEIRDWLANPAS